MTCQKDELIFNLTILAEGRKKLIADFIGENPEIYTPIFKYENSSYQMKLSKEKYFLSWVDYHWIIADKHFGVEKKNQESIRNSFYKVFLQLLKLFGLSSTGKEMSEFFEHLLKERIVSLESINKKGDNINKKFEALTYNYERDKALFEREINRMKGYVNGVVKDVRQIG